MPSQTGIKLPAFARWTPALQSLPALAIRQPYAWLVVNGIKDIENRSRRTHHRGQILIHASLNDELLLGDSLAALSTRAGVVFPDSFKTGGIVGVAEIIACERSHESDWKDPSSWGWVMANARPLPFRPCKGALGFFRPKYKNSKTDSIPMLAEGSSSRLVHDVRRVREGRPYNRSSSNDTFG